MIAPELVQNVRHTYQSLAETLPETQTLPIPGGTMTFGALRHPIANFAVIDEPENWEPVPIPGTWFHVYVLEDGPPRAEIPGYRRSYELALMVHPPLEVARYAPPLKLAEQPKERLAVARFMTRQFFMSASRENAERVCEVTTKAVALDLAAFHSGWPGRIEAAVMLSRSPGQLGLYNLCVDAKIRRQGRGELIVRRVVQMAAEEGRQCSLQCDPKLEAWYEKLGFARVGTLSAWVPELEL